MDVSRWRSYMILATLLLMFVSNQWSRQLMNYLVNFSSNAANDSFKYINVSLQFDKEYYATLTSFSFTLMFSLCSLFVGTFADRYQRQFILIGSCLCWNILTILQSYVTNSNQLVPLRVLLGVSQSFFNPAAYTLLYDLFPKEMHGRINSIFRLVLK